MAISISLIALILSLVFGLSGFLNNILGKCPSMGQLRRVTPTSAKDTELFIENNGTGPAIITKIIVRYRDDVNGIDVWNEANNSNWLKELIEKIVRAYGDAKLPPMHNVDLPAHKNSWARGTVILGPGKRLPILQADEIIVARHAELCTLMSYLTVEMEYKSFYGIRYTTTHNYDPLGNVEKRPWVFGFYVLIAKILGLIT